MTTHLLLAFGKDAAGVTLALVFLLGMAAWAAASLVASAGSGKWR